MVEHSAPLRYETKGINITPKPSVDRFRDDAALVLRSMAQAKRIAVQDELLNEKDRQLARQQKEISEALTDTLTKLPTMRVFESDFPKALRRNRQRIGLAVLDLNGLKRVNDELGHSEGNHLLALLSDSIRDHLRPEDRMYRLGGDEFGILFFNFVMPDDPDEINNRLEGVFDDAVQREEYPEELKLGVTAAVGIPNVGESPEAFFDRVDSLMINRKRQHYLGLGIQFNDTRLLPPQNND